MVVKVGGFRALRRKTHRASPRWGGTSLADFSTYRAGLSSGSRHKANGCVPRRLSRSCTSKSELWTLGKSVDLESRQHLMSGFLARKPQTVNRYPTFRAPAVLPWAMIGSQLLLGCACEPLQSQHGVPVHVCLLRFQIFQVA